MRGIRIRPRRRSGRRLPRAGARSARFIAGGTNLLDLMKLEVETPEKLVDISRLPLDEVEETDEGGLRIGALVPNADLAAHRAVRERYAVLSRALLAGASGQLRNKASTGGNLLQRTRCYYFYDTAHALQQARAGLAAAARSAASTASTRSSAQASNCIATHPSDMAVAMRALDAKVETLKAGRADPHARARRILPPAGRHAGGRDRARAGRADHPCRAAPRPGRRPGLSQGARPRLLRLRARLGRVCRRGGGRPDLLGASRLRRARPHAVARRGGRGRCWSARRPRASSSSGPPTRCCADARGHGGNDFKIPLAQAHPDRMPRTDDGRRGMSAFKMDEPIGETRARPRRAGHHRRAAEPGRGQAQGVGRRALRGRPPGRGRARLRLRDLRDHRLWQGEGLRHRDAPRRCRACSR